ncbi:MAG TPA: septal ring lytic transglycosylase RlpA family protein [Candidatus Nitrosotenuis sp.]|nr:septal ring lytic transglycosylase RlpA family protein [Candidatus Nitrosotenuis sp.]
MRAIVVVTIIGLLLSGCSTTPPVRNPAKDLCAGTKRPYTIKGETYYPQDHFDYEEEGLASWYGPGFHERPKSCGGRYDMHGLSAAHKTLPIPSVVEVTNTKNGKSLTLVVDDRGPFVNNRIIDLSKGAAHYLGVYEEGLAPVKVRAIPHESVALVNYLKQFGPYGKPDDGRSWDTIYRQEIAGQYQSVEEVHHKQPKLLSTVARSDTSRPPAKLRPAVAQIEKSSPLPKPKPAVYHQESTHEFDQLLQEISTSQSPKRKRSQAPQKASRKAFSSKPHYIQVGTFVQRHNAEKLRRELARMGQANVAETRKSGQKFYAVKLGPFDNQHQAKKILTTLTNDGHYAVMKIH